MSVQNQSTGDRTEPTSESPNPREGASCPVLCISPDDGAAGAGSDRESVRGGSKPGEEGGSAPVVFLDERQGPSRYRPISREEAIARIGLAEVIQTADEMNPGTGTFKALGVYVPKWLASISTARFVDLHTTFVC